MMIRRLALWTIIPLFSWPALAAMDCSGLPKWADSYPTIQPGQQVQHVGSAYQCKAFPEGAWCTLSAYEPATANGNMAWDFIDTCIDVLPPVVSINAPTFVRENTRFTVTADVTDPSAVGIAKVDFRLIDADGAITDVASDTSAPFEAEYPGLVAGRYRINVVATDAGQTESVPTEKPVIALDQTEPAILLDSPPDNAAYTEGEDVRVHAYATTFNPNDSVQNVEFFSNGASQFVDTVAPYEYTMTSMVAGQYSIHAVVNTTLGLNKVSNTANISVTKYGPSADAFIPYWTYWGTASADVTQLTGKTTILNMAFAQVNNNFQVVADDLLQYSGTDTPQTVNYVAPEYMDWTLRKYQFPNTRVLLSFGGATYSAQWDLLKTTSNVPPFVDAIEAVTNQQYPVYIETSPGSGTYEKQGYVQLDGADLDIESIGMEQNPTWSANIASMIADYGTSNPLKSITLTGIHTGADPVSCQAGGSFESGCSFPAGSAYAGSMTGVLQSIKDRGINLTNYNVMAYDAGIQGVDYDWHVALTNLSQYLPKNKIVLGVSIGAQWGPSGTFVEDMASIQAKAQEQKALGYGGVMSWAVGAGGGQPADQQVLQMNDIADSFK